MSQYQRWFGLIHCQKNPITYVLEDNDNENMILLPNDTFIKTVDLDLQDLLKEKTKEDNFFLKVLKTMKGNRPTPIHSKLEDWAVDNDLLFYL